MLGPERWCELSGAWISPPVRPADQEGVGRRQLKTGSTDLQQCSWQCRRGLLQTQASCGAHPSSATYKLNDLDQGTQPATPSSPVTWRWRLLGDWMRWPVLMRNAWEGPLPLEGHIWGSSSEAAAQLPSFMDFQLLESQILAAPKVTPTPFLIKFLTPFLNLITKCDPKFDITPNPNLRPHLNS